MNQAGAEKSPGHLPDALQSVSDGQRSIIIPTCTYQRSRTAKV